MAETALAMMLTELAQEFNRILQEAGVPPTQPEITSSDCSPASVPPAGSPSLGCQSVDFAAKGYHLNVSVEPTLVVAAARLLDQKGFAMDAITGVDWLADNQMELVYDYFHPQLAWRVAVRARIPRSNPEIPTISTVFPGADWHERETHDFFGIRFLGHPNLIPLLLPEDAAYHPLLKDFTA